MPISTFIMLNVDPLLAAWDQHARELPGARALTLRQLRSDAREILFAIATDMRRPQSDHEQMEKSEGHDWRAVAPGMTAAEHHGAERAQLGFSAVQVTGEYRALRANVMRLWMQQATTADLSTVYALTRFHEAVDQQLIQALSQIEATHSTAASTAAIDAMAGSSL